jgi:hypothetical protein
MDNIPAAGKEITIIPATGITKANPARTCGITMIPGIVGINGLCIRKAVRGITTIPSISCLTGTTQPPREANMILKGREPISINPGGPA